MLSCRYSCHLYEAAYGEILSKKFAHIKQGAAVCDIGGFALTAAIKERCARARSRVASTQAMVREIAKRFPAFRINGYLDLVPIGH